VRNMAPPSRNVRQSPCGGFGSALVGTLLGQLHLQRVVLQLRRLRHSKEEGEITN
jgi:hypothetical protein